MARTILLAGATGLVGNMVLELALNDPDVARVLVPTRHLLPPHPKLEQWVHADLEKALKDHSADAVICCLGTTMRKVGGNRDAFIHVDKSLVLALGTWAKANAVGIFCVVSAMGSDPSSMIFYNRVKGEMEQELSGLELPSLHIFRPSILTGPRKESRIGERIGIAVTKVFTALLPTVYKPMPYDVLAQALMTASTMGTGGTYTYERILTLAEART